MLDAGNEPTNRTISNISLMQFGNEPEVGPKTATGRYTYLKLLDDGDVAPCIVDIFEIEVLKTSDKFNERGERRLDWMSPDEAARRVREIELKSFLVEFKPSK